MIDLCCPMGHVLVHDIGASDLATMGSMVVLSCDPCGRSYFRSSLTLEPAVA